ncbi:MAG: ATP-binding protein [Alphaproteobacteria bacterium]|nr:ATP-binding protein [Alphaproteobacteria bacterium]
MSLRLLNLKKIMSDLSANIFIVVDKEGNILDYNAKAHDFLGSSKIFQQSFCEFFDDYVVSTMKQYFQDIQNNQLPHCFVIDIREKLYDCCIYPYSFGYVFSFDDITEFRDFASYTNELTKRIQHAGKISAIGYFEFDVNGKRHFFSKEIYKILGTDKSKDMLGNVIEKYMHPKDVAKYERNINKLLKSEKKIETNIRFVRNDGKVISCLLKANVVFSEVENKVVCTLQDLTNYMDSQKMLKEAKRKAEEISRAKSYFIVQASHDLRQPIQAIRMFLHRFKQEKMDKKQTEILSNIDSSVEGLSYLLDNLMDISKLDYGGIKSHSYQFDLKQLLQKLQKEYKEIAKVKEIEFSVKMFNAKIYSDPFFVERIIRNLLSNAFKFTKNFVELGMEKIDEKKIRIYIQDNGMGIKKSEQEYIFNEFFQSKGLKGHQKEGIGLGLPIVHRMAKALGASVSLESKANKGTRFTVDLPIKEEAA